MSVYKFKTEVIFAIQAETFEEAMELAGLCHDEALEAIHTQGHISPITDEVTHESHLTDEDLIEWASENVEEILNEELEAKPLTTEELKAGKWWCGDISPECARAFESKGLYVFNSSEWRVSGTWNCCEMYADGNVSRKPHATSGKKQIHRIGNEFYWS